MSNEDKKKEKEEKSTFKKIEGGMLYFDEEGETAAVGFPQKTREIIEGKGGFWARLMKGIGVEVEGKKESETEFNWVFVTNKFLEPSELEEKTKAVTTASGTIAVSTFTAVTPPPQPPGKICPKCGVWNNPNAIYCNQCGSVL